MIMQIKFTLFDLNGIYPFKSNNQSGIWNNPKLQKQQIYFREIKNFNQ